MKIYGPYTRKDGRKHVIHYDGKTRRTQSYPRYLMEQKLGRELEILEQVDHKNEDHTDDNVENFQILTQGDNNRKSFKEQGRSAKWLSFVCPECNTNFSILAIVIKEIKYLKIKKVLIVLVRVQEKLHINNL